MSKFGQNNYGGTNNFTKRNRYKLKDGDNVYRILPAMGDLAEEGRWSVFYNVVFGFKTTDGKHRPFQSPQVVNRKTKMVDVPCAATSLIKDLKAKLDEAKRAGNKDQAAQLAKIVGDFPVMGVYNLNNDHYMNVVDRQNNVGQLELGHKAKLALQAEIDRIRKDEGFDPLSADNGRFFNIRRTGRGLDTSYNVTVVKDKIEVPGIGPNGGVGKVERDVVHVIDDALSERLLTKKNGKWIYKEAANLKELYKSPTSEEVELIVKNADIGTGKSSGIDLVFDKTKSETQVVNDNFETDLTEPAQEEAQAVSLAEEPAVTVEAPVVTETKTAVTVAQQATAATVAPKTTAEAVAAMTPDEFMKTLGVNL
jgi:hypothetical protein